MRFKAFWTPPTLWSSLMNKSEMVARYYSQIWFVSSHFGRTMQLCLQSSVITELAEKNINMVCGGTVTFVVFRVPPGVGWKVIIFKKKEKARNEPILHLEFNELQSRFMRFHTLPFHISHFFAHFQIDFLFCSIKTIQTSDVKGHFWIWRRPFPCEGKKAQKPETFLSCGGEHWGPGGTWCFVRLSSACFLTALFSQNSKHITVLVSWCIFSTGEVSCRNFLAFLCIYHSKAKETEVSRDPINLQPIKLAQVIAIVTQDTGKWTDVFY